MLARLCASRQIDPDASPTLPSPQVFPDIGQAVSRIHQAIERGERIGLFGDYDCDGITATAQLVRFFRRRNVEPWVRLPHRVHDGYGLTPATVEEIQAANIDLLITADTGITAVAEIAALQASGTDVIVTDHHHVHEELPPAVALVHPALTNLNAPHPSGAGVVLFLLHALEGAHWEDIATDYALAMLGTVADLVELRGVNRSLTQLGLRALQHLPSGPLAECRNRIQASNQALTSTDIAFRMAPRINAAGRMSSPTIALQALLEGGDALQELDLLNEQRQQQTQQLYDKVLQELPDDLPPVIVSVSPEYSHGIVGLLAGKLTEQFGRPSVVGTHDGTTVTASLRSPTCYTITDGLHAVAPHLLRYGGHAQAAGCTFLLSELDAVRTGLEADVRTHVDQADLVPTLAIDAILEASDVTLEFCNTLHTLEPFGQGNAEPRFLIRNVVLSDGRTCGGDHTHLQATIGRTKSIGFGLGFAADIREPVDVVVRLGINEWQGHTNAQLFIEDIAHVQKTAPTKSTVLS